MYKLLSDYRLLPENLRIDRLAGDSQRFQADYGVSQIQFYFDRVRPTVKDQVFRPMNTELHFEGLTSGSGKYLTTKDILPTLDARGGKTSIVDGHAFEKQPVDYNTAFVGILRKLSALPHITRLDAGFKSRVYEQFLRRDPNTSKVTGEYFTPRNVVKAIVQMAEVGNLHASAVVCDPACGVGGFMTEAMLELERCGISNYRADREGRIEVDRKFIGLEVLEDVVCLAKANVLLHCIELFSSFSNAAKANFSELLADIIVHCHEDGTLGTLAHPCEQRFDLVMANPPYMVNGTMNVTKKIKERGIASFYDAGGTGLESRFVNWIVNSLKAGGRAFVVLPKSMLARDEKRFKAWVLRKCIIDAVIYLPERTFYITPNPTYIIAITRKHDEKQQQGSPVFCYYIRDIGETRDTQREPTRNDLVDMVDEYRLFKANRQAFAPATGFCKKVGIETFASTSRWDIDYLWTPDELARLSVVDTNVRPCPSLIDEFHGVLDDLDDAREFINARFTQCQSSVSLSLRDGRYFKIHRGERVTKEQCKKHPGDVPVVSSGRHEDSYLGTISEAFLESRGLPVFRQCDTIMTVGATGAVGTVHMRKEPQWFLHDDAMGIEVMDAGLHPEYVRCALQRVIDRARFDYTAKLYRARLEALTVEVPVDASGGFDLPMQISIAEAYQREEQINRKLRQLAAHLQSVKVQF